MKTTLHHAALVITLLVLAGCKAEETHKLPPIDLPVVAVQTMAVIIQEDYLQTEVVGTVQSIDQAVIAAKVTGTIEEMPVVLGSTVKAGDLLLKISAGELSARAIQAEAQLEQAGRNLEREKKLLLKNAATSENVKSLEDMYKVAEAVHREAVIMLSYITVNAPFDGIITAKMSNVGDLATPGVPLLHLEDNSRLQIETSVPETLVLQIQPGDTLLAHIPAANLDRQGTVAEIAPVIDPLSRTATVKINITPGPRLRSGQFARVIIPGDRKKTLFVPSSAIHSFGQMEKIFVSRENRAHLRLIRTGITVDDLTEVLAGLDPGETIITTNSSQLVDGQPVKTIQ